MHNAGGRAANPFPRVVTRWLSLMSCSALTKIDTGTNIQGNDARGRMNGNRG